MKQYYKFVAIDLKDGNGLRFMTWEQVSVLIGKPLNQIKTSLLELKNKGFIEFEEYRTKHKELVTALQNNDTNTIKSFLNL